MTAKKTKWGSLFGADEKQPLWTRQGPPEAPAKNSLKFGNIWGSDAGTNPWRKNKKRDLGVSASLENKRIYNRIYWRRLRSPHRPSPKVRDGKHRKHPKLVYEERRKR